MNNSRIDWQNSNTTCQKQQKETKWTEEAEQMKETKRMARKKQTEQTEQTDGKNETEEMDKNRRCEFTDQKDRKLFIGWNKWCTNVWIRTHMHKVRQSQVLLIHSARTSPARVHARIYRLFSHLRTILNRLSFTCIMKWNAITSCDTRRQWDGELSQINQSIRSWIEMGKHNSSSPMALQSDTKPYNRTVTRIQSVRVNRRNDKLMGRN